MINRPSLETDRLILRPSRAEDAGVISELLNDRSIPDTAMYIPYPCPISVVQDWISKHQKKYEDGVSSDFYIELKSSGNVVGAVHLDFDKENDSAELGYWIGKPYWNQKYATEAVKAVLTYALDQRNVRRVFAYYLCRNIGSRRVLEKCGLTPEGILRKHVKKWDKYEDIQYFSLMRDQGVDNRRL